MSLLTHWLRLLAAGLGWVGKGIHTVMLNILAMLGAVAVFAALVLYTHPDLLNRGEQWLYSHLYQRKVAQVDLDVEHEALERVTAVDLLDLSEEQAAAAFWLSKKYRVAPEPMGALVAQAYSLGEKRGLDPRLILSVVAIESRFNPFAQSAVGAQGLMQVMTSVHEDKYQHFGGTLAAFDPVSNMQVGSLILKDCIDRFGGVQRGLVCYVGAAKLPNDGGYSSKVLAEHERLKEATRNAAKVLPASFKTARLQRQADLALAEQEPTQTTGLAPTAQPLGLQPTVAALTQASPQPRKTGGSAAPAQPEKAAQVAQAQTVQSAVHMEQLARLVEEHGAQQLLAARSNLDGVPQQVSEALAQ
ncbi:lytic transglycosylase domain-containing protein [Vandammella animalimorsus]|uniref:Lytic transglycosylase domain-containing protein n=1 Tax=Vandammella animalimorsus TaxID=2029117 RepID=A0A3M6RJF9_9BURK|nr:lytic transglycosylase domain-containing protein [Vandammella animalimorsus]RMX15451.1 lytic transglycosylase domain-containing protein [Vandammella animalimorsus]